MAARSSALAALFLIVLVVMASVSASSDPEAPLAASQQTAAGPGIAAIQSSRPASLGIEPAVVYGEGSRVYVAPWSLDGKAWPVPAGWPALASWSGLALAVAGSEAVALLSPGPWGGLSWTLYMGHGISGAKPVQVAASGLSVAALYEGPGVYVASLHADDIWGTSGIGVVIELSSRPIAVAVRQATVYVAFEERGDLLVYGVEWVSGAVEAWLLDAGWVEWACPVSGSPPSILAGGGGLVAWVDLERLEAAVYKLGGYEGCLNAYSEGDTLSALLKGPSGGSLVFLYRNGPAAVYDIIMTEGFRASYIASSGGSVALGLEGGGWSLAVYGEPRSWGSLSIITPEGIVVAEALWRGTREFFTGVSGLKPIEADASIIEAVSFGQGKADILEAECCAPVAGALSASPDFAMPAAVALRFFHEALEAARRELLTLAVRLGEIDIDKAIGALEVLAAAPHEASVHAVRALTLLESSSSWQDAVVKAHSLVLSASGVADYSSPAGSYLKPTAAMELVVSSEPDSLLALSALADSQRLALSPALTRDPSLPSRLMVELVSNSEGVEGLDDFIALVNGLPGLDAGAGVELLPWVAPLAFRGLLMEAAAGLALSAAYERALSLASLASSLASGDPPEGLPGACAVIGPLGGNALPYVSRYDALNIDLHRTVLSGHEVLVDCGGSVFKERVPPAYYIPLLTRIGMVESSGYVFMVAEALIDGQAVPRLLASIASDSPPGRDEWLITIWEVSSGELPMIAASKSGSRVVAAVYAGGYKLYLGELQRLSELDYVIIASTSGAVEGGERLIPVKPPGASAVLVKEGSIVSVKGEAVAILQLQDSVTVIRLTEGSYMARAGYPPRAIETMGGAEEQDPKPAGDGLSGRGDEVQGVEQRTWDALQPLIIALTVLAAATTAAILLAYYKKRR